jgi:ABC-type transporter Mla subunit MlaD
MEQLSELLDQINQTVTRLAVAHANFGEALQLAERAAAELRARLEQQPTVSQARQQCQVYRAVGCAYVDGPLCNVHVCSVRVAATITPNAITEKHCD